MADDKARSWVAKGTGEKDAELVQLRVGLLNKLGRKNVSNRGHGCPKKGGGWAK